MGRSSLIYYSSIYHASITWDWWANRTKTPLSQILPGFAGISKCYYYTEIILETA